MRASITRVAALAAALLGAACSAPQETAADPSLPCPEGAAGPHRGRCLLVTSFGAPRSETLVVVLHGDVSAGGQATYHQALARRIADAAPGTAVVALVRPGYPDGLGRLSDGEAHGRSDHYTAPNMALVAGAIAALRAGSGARHVLAVGHSGGAATAANILALHPGTVQAAVLVACPCALDPWRVGRRPWSSSVDPWNGIAAVPAVTRLVAFTGTLDDNTRPGLARDYVARLAARGVAARFVSVPDAGHNDVVSRMWDHGFAAALAALSRPE